MTRRVLHLDDDPTITRLVHEGLVRYDFETLPIHDPELLIPTLVDQGIRVVLLDIDLGTDKNGLDWLVDLKRMDGGIQVVMLTGLVTNHSVLAAMRCGAADCLFKPVDSLSDVAKALEGAFAFADHWRFRLHELNRRLQRSGEPAALAGR